MMASKDKKQNFYVTEPHLRIILVKKAVRNFFK